jgi:hypothetical protein
MSPEPVDIATQLMREFAALNTATERAHQAIADMRAERKLLDERRTELHTLAKQIGAVTSKAAEVLIEAEVNRQLEALGPKIQDSLNGAVATASRKLGGAIQEAVKVAVMGEFKQQIAELGRAAGLEVGRKRGHAAGQRIAGQFGPGKAKP